MLRTSRPRTATAALAVLLTGALLAAPGAGAAGPGAAPQARTGTSVASTTFTVDLGRGQAFGSKMSGSAPQRTLILPAKVSFSRPAGAGDAGAYGSATAKIDGEKVTGSISTDSRPDGTYYRDRFTFIFDIKPHHVGKKIKVTRMSLEFYSTPTVTAAGPAKSDSAGVKAYALAYVNHFPKKKVLFVHGRYSYTGKNSAKYLRDPRRWPRLAGAKVIIEKRTDRGWKKIGTARLDRSGTARVKKRVGKQANAFRVRFTGDATRIPFTAAGISWTGSPRSGWPGPKARVIR